MSYRIERGARGGDGGDVVRPVAEWRSFEQAVAAFLKALDPAATVVHDAYTPDLDTGLPRQRDVWIETSLFGGLLALKILVSCKHKKARLSQQDIDAFVGELRASGAQKGVLYSHAGFSKPALAKAERLGISCCGLFESRPADLPLVLAVEAYGYRERVRLDVEGASLADVAPWFDEPLARDPDQLTLLGRLIVEYESKREAVMAEALAGPRGTWFSEASLAGPQGAITIRLSSGWTIYRARREAWLLNGSYSFTDQAFAGEMSTPWIDQQSLHPGPGWELIGPEDVDATATRVVAYSHGGEFESGLRAVVANAIGEADGLVAD